MTEEENTEKLNKSEKKRQNKINKKGETNVIITEKGKTKEKRGEKNE